jgi:hypothetical protein
MVAVHGDGQLARTQSAIAHQVRGHLAYLIGEAF